MVYKQVQQNSFNLTSDNPEMLIIQHLRRVVPKPEVLLYTRRKLYQWTKQTWWKCSKRPPRMSGHQLLWHLMTLVYYSINCYGISWHVSITTSSVTASHDTCLLLHQLLRHLMTLVYYSINCYGISWHLSITPSTSSATKTPDNTEEDPDGHEPAEGGGIQMKYRSD